MQVWILECVKVELFIGLELTGMQKGATSTSEAVKDDQLSTQEDRASHIR